LPKLEELKLSIMETILDKREGLFPSGANKLRCYSPLANIQQQEDEYILTIGAPGFQRNQFAVVVDKDILSISTINKEKIRHRKGSNYEYDYSHWHRKFILPGNADSTMIASNYINGELIIHIPKYNKHIVHDDVLNVVVY
jgi:HSP20 family protein